MPTSQSTSFRTELAKVVVTAILVITVMFAAGHANDAQAKGGFKGGGNNYVNVLNSHIEHANEMGEEQCAIVVRSRHLTYVSPGYIDDVFIDPLGDGYCIVDGTGHKIAGLLVEIRDAQ